MADSYQIDLGSSPRCRECGVTLPEAAVLCVKCGTDQRTGKRVNVAVEALPKKPAGKPSAPAPVKKKPKEPFGEVCAQCGYDLTTLPGKRCPECGSSKRVNAARQERRQKDLQRYWRNTVLTGCIAGLLGYAAAIGISAAQGGSPVVTAIGVTVTIACAQAAYFGMCLLWFGFEETLLGSAIRICGVGAVWAALWFMLSTVPFAFVFMGLAYMILSILCIAAPFKMLLGREWWECVMTAGAAWLLRIIVAAAFSI